MGKLQTIIKTALLLPALLFLTNLFANGTQSKYRLTADTVIIGIVTDAANNQPLAGANIVMKESGISAITNEAGRFTLALRLTTVNLVVTHAGYQPAEIKIDESAIMPLTIALQRSGQELEEVTILSTGYQKISKEKIVGAVTVVGNELLNQQTGPHILQRLNNVTSGLLFNTGKTDASGNPNELSIRGLSTISGPVRPLIVLDNFIYEGDIANITPNDVENISVLKDAAATSLWGARAGNGVIVITTKKAAFSQRPVITLNANWIVTQKPDLFYPSAISVNDYIDVETFLFDKGYFNNTIDNTVQKSALSPVVEILLQKRDGVISENEAKAQVDALRAVDSREQFDRAFYRKGLTQQYNVSAAGGSNNVNWLLSGSLDRSIYTLSNTYDKANLRLNNTYRPLKNLSVNLNILYSGSKALSGLTPSNIINGRTIPYLSFINADGTVAPVNRYRREFTDTVGSGLLSDWKLYPLEDYKHDRTTIAVNEILAGAGIHYRIIPSLHLNVNYQYQLQATNTNRLADENSFYTRDLLNTFAQPDYSNSTVNYIVPRGAIFNQNRNLLTSQNLRAQLNYDKTFEAHSISGIVGSEIREVKREVNSVAYYGYNEDPLSYSQVSHTEFYPSLVTGNHQQIPGAPSLSAKINNRFVSFYGNLSYSFKQRYTAYGSVRKDASNVFGLSTNDKWNPFWSAGIKWGISNEAFYKSNWLSQLQFRASYGHSGNVDVNKTALPISSSGFTDFRTRFPIMTINNPNNPLLRWEKVRQVNLGFDFALLKNNITGNIDYYIKNGSDLYGTTPFDYTAFPLINIVERNVAAMKGDGIDIQINSLNVNKVVRWNTMALFSYALSKTSSYYADASVLAGTLVGGGGGITPIVGYPLYATAAYKWAGLTNNGDPQGYLDGEKSTDYNAINTVLLDDALTNNTIVYIGTTTPKYFGALINELRWKNFTTSVNISYNLGYYFRKIPFTSDALIDRGISPTDYERRWQKPGDENHTSIPALVYTDYPQFNNRDIFFRYSEVNVLRGDHIRLQYINLGYQFHSKSGILKQAGVYINMANLGILWRANKEGLDPDYTATSPMPANFTAGFRLTL